jgi:transcriptional regulator with XRE-family HTH domain
MAGIAVAPPLLIVFILRFQHRTPIVAVMSSGTESATLATVISTARQYGGVDVPAALSLSDLARRAAISPSQLSRIESGQLRKPNRAILVALGRALNRNPIPLLVLVGHITGTAAQLELRDYFRPGAEAPQEWGGWASLPLSNVIDALRTDQPDEGTLRTIAADVFSIQDTAETVWDDAYALAAATGPKANAMRQLAGLLRELDRADWPQLLAHATALRDRNDLRHQLNEARTAPPFAPQPDGAHS